MADTFISELKWRGLLQDMSSEVEDVLKTPTTAYIGFDPTADSLHIGSLVQIIILKHFQNYGHRPVILVGGATGMVGDPSGKSKERNLLDEKTLSFNIVAILKQLKRFIRFGHNRNEALLVNNYDWTKGLNLIDFIRDIGKHITVNYMLAKESVKKRVHVEDAQGMSFTEFTYQLFQAYDFLYLFEHEDCVLQMGGSDQWGNITTGIELIRRKTGKKSFGLTCQLVSKSDGSKFGKTEKGNIWLDPKKTSPYEFYQFWLNIDDLDAERYIKYFTFLTREEIEILIARHREHPHQRILQYKLADLITEMVHSKETLNKVKKASDILFGSNTTDSLNSVDKSVFLSIFEGVPRANLTKEALKGGLDMIGVLSAKTGFLKSNKEAVRSLEGNAISVNKVKVTKDYIITEKDLVLDHYILLQKGKKNYFILNFSDEI